MVDVSIITPIWNKSSLTHKFLYHNWMLYQNRPEIEFVIVNNGSTDNTEPTLQIWQKTMAERLSVRNLVKNHGFSGGNNEGAAIARGDLLIFLSNDVAPYGDYVATIQQAAKDDVLIGAELFSRDTGWNTFGDRFFPYLAGWCIAANRATWDKIGGWDERYFPCDYEDIDLSTTAIERGIKLKQVGLPLQHAFGQTAQQISGGRHAITMESQRKFIEKWNLK